MTHCGRFSLWTDTSAGLAAADDEDGGVDLGRRAAMHAESRMLIDGELVAATDGAEFDNVSPATGLELGRTAAAQAQDMPR